MTTEQLLREGLADLADEARPDADYLAGVERHIRTERRRRRTVQGTVVALSIVLLAAAVLTVPLLRRVDPGPASPTTTTRQAERVVPGESYWVGKADVQLVLAEGIEPARRAALSRQLEAMPLVERVTYESPAEVEAHWGPRSGTPEASLMVKLRDPGGYEEFRARLCRGGQINKGCVDGVEDVRPVLSDAEAHARGEAQKRDRAAALAAWGEQIERLRVGGTVPKSWLTSAVLEVAVGPPLGPVTVVAEGRTVDRRRLVLLAYEAVAMNGPDHTCLLVLGTRARERSFQGCAVTWGADEGRILLGGAFMDGRLVVAGAAPPGTRRVRIGRRAGRPLVVDATTVRRYTWSFYLTQLPRGDITMDITALDAAGRVLARSARS